MAIGSCSKCFCGVIRNIHVQRMPIRRSTSCIDAHLSSIRRCSKQIANKMRLYHHTTRCPVAMQLVLDTNPDLWCFVPMTNEQAMIDDLDFFSTDAPIVIENGKSFITSIGGKKSKPTCHKSDNSNAVDRFISQVSTPLNGYSFTHRQREQQRLLFQRMLDRSFHWVGKCHLFEATIIAVRKSLDACSSSVRSVGLSR